MTCSSSPPPAEMSYVLSNFVPAGTKGMPSSVKVSVAGINWFSPRPSSAPGPVALLPPLEGRERHRSLQGSQGPQDRQLPPLASLGWLWAPWPALPPLKRPQGVRTLQGRQASRAQAPVQVRELQGLRVPYRSRSNRA